MVLSVTFLISKLKSHVKRKKKKYIYITVRQRLYCILVRTLHNIKLGFAGLVCCIQKHI